MQIGELLSNIYWNGRVITRGHNLHAKSGNACILDILWEKNNSDVFLSSLWCVIDCVSEYLIKHGILHYKSVNISVTRGMEIFVH